MTKSHFLFIIFTSHSLFLTAQIALFEVGAGQGIITPSDTAYIAGHSHNRIFSGVNDDIFVKALVVSNRTDTIAILTFDCIGLLHPELERIRAGVLKELPDFPVDQIVMTSSHTHSGPDVVGLWGKDTYHSGVDKTYMSELISTTVSTLLDAWSNRQTTSVIYASGEHGSEWVYNISEPEELDRSLTVLSFVNSDSETVATLSNFACHPTFLDAVNDQVSSDYVGGYYAHMDQQRGGINLFLQGSIGGWVQPEYEDKTVVQAFFRGEELAKKAIDIINDPDTLFSNQILFDSKKFMLPVDNPGFRLLSDIGVLSRPFGDSVLTEVAVFSIGEATFATHPGETVPQLSHRTKAMMPDGGPKFILGLGMDALGYILKPYFFDQAEKIPHSEYLCSVSLGISTQELIFNQLKQLFDQRRDKN